MVNRSRGVVIADRGARIVIDDRRLPEARSRLQVGVSHWGDQSVLIGRDRGLNVMPLVTSATASQRRGQFSFAMIATVWRSLPLVYTMLTGSVQLPKLMGRLLVRC